MKLEMEIDGDISRRIMMFQFPVASKKGRCRIGEESTKSQENNNSDRGLSQPTFLIGDTFPKGQVRANGCCRHFKNI